ncbi:hypothetical protein T03_8853 [Trichinella britovi]|uniref:Uncharacterized protein n=1 Tax=Trichinella britovi TaxID=45882 RepID=A0A0V0YSA7_TRIBR|nr:hypothetical protein T03_8853 [Trichinella britovi]
MTIRVLEILILNCPSHISNSFSTVAETANFCT